MVGVAEKPRHRNSAAGVSSPNTPQHTEGQDATHKVLCTRSALHRETAAQRWCASRREQAGVGAEAA